MFFEKAFEEVDRTVADARSDYAEFSTKGSGTSIEDVLYMIDG